MKIPQFWSKGTAEGQSRDGRNIRCSCWRPSQISKADAHESAIWAAKRILDAIVRGEKLDRYGYGSVPLREEVIDTLQDDEGNVIAAVTRNLYGSLVLNTQRVMFFDIDFPAISVGEAIKHFFARLIGRARLSPEAQEEEKARSDIEQFLAANPSWNIRLYRTYAGLRGIVTHDVFDPASGAALDILQRFRSDPLYVRLCKAQECFRARLTPKPWRCAYHANTLRYPVEEPELAERYEKWKAEYDARQRGYATCRFLGSLGSGDLHPEVQRVVDLHDHVTRCNEALALA